MYIVKILFVGIFSIMFSFSNSFFSVVGAEESSEFRLLVLSIRDSNGDKLTDAYCQVSTLDLQVLQDEFTNSDGNVFFSWFGTQSEGTTVIVACLAENSVINKTVYIFPNSFNYIVWSNNDQKIEAQNF